QWFWSTVAVGVAQITAAFVAPIYLLVLWLRSEQVEWAVEGSSLLGVATVALAFASAVFCGCVSRKSVLAAVMAFGLGLAVSVGAAYATDLGEKWRDGAAALYLPARVGGAACVAAVVANMVGSLSRNRGLGALAAAGVFAALVWWGLNAWTEAVWPAGTPMADHLVLLAGATAALLLAAALAVRRDWVIGRE
ncbi:MAG: hypothetical protein AAF805_05900, partial [Planctomycetota bacterium]